MRHRRFRDMVLSVIGVAIISILLTMALINNELFKAYGSAGTVIIISLLIILDMALVIRIIAVNIGYVSAYCSKCRMGIFYQELDKMAYATTPKCPKCDEYIDDIIERT